MLCLHGQQLNNKRFTLLTYFPFEDRKIQCLGLVQSLFEGSMYTFVLEWTPALKPAHDDVVHNVYAMNDTSTEEYYEGHRGAIPHGHIFATFMVIFMTYTMTYIYII